MGSKDLSILFLILVTLILIGAVGCTPNTAVIDVKLTPSDVTRAALDSLIAKDFDGAYEYFVTRNATVLNETEKQGLKETFENTPILDYEIKGTIDLETLFERENASAKDREEVLEDLKNFEEVVVVLHSIKLGNGRQEEEISTFVGKVQGSWKVIYL